MAVSSYNPSNVLVTYGTHIVEGFAEGTMVSITRNNDSFNLSVGSTGSGARAKSNDQSARISFMLQQTSPSNTILSAFLQQDELTGTAVYPLFIKEGGNLYVAETAWIVKPPDVEYSNEITTREWTIETDKLTMTLAGA